MSPFYLDKEFRLLSQENMIIIWPIFLNMLITDNCAA